MHKAQGFNVFQLFISTIILMILLMTFLVYFENTGFNYGSHSSDFSPTPLKESKDLTKDALVSLNTAQFYSGIEFKKGIVLTSRAIASATYEITDELTADDVCLVLDSRLPESSWEVEDNKKIVYKGSSPISAKITVLCGYSDTIKELGIQNFFEQSTIGYQVDLSGCPIPEDYSKYYCIVAIKRAD